MVPKVCWKRPLDLLSSQAPVRRPNLKQHRPSWSLFQRSPLHLPWSRPKSLEDTSRPTPLTNITPTTDPRGNKPVITPTTWPTRHPTPLQDPITATVQDGKTPRTETQNSALCAEQWDSMNLQTSCRGARWCVSWIIWVCHHQIDQFVGWLQLGLWTNRPNISRKTSRPDEVCGVMVFLFCRTLQSEEQVWSNVPLRDWWLENFVIHMRSVSI